MLGAPAGAALCGLAIAQALVALLDAVFAALWALSACSIAAVNVTSHYLFRGFWNKSTCGDTSHVSRSARGAAEHC